MTKTYYVRFMKDNYWVNALRNHEKYVTLEVANEMMDTLESNGVKACLFEVEQGNFKESPVVIRRTLDGVEV